MEPSEAESVLALAPMDWIIALALFGTGILIAGILSKVAGKVMQRSTGPHFENIVRKLTFWGVSLLVLFLSLQNMGVELTAVLATAGIFGIAVGFAAQTSVSNIISGIFLLFEQPFQVGDAIKVGDTMGVVQSIDLLSVKLREFDNLYTRVPNETFIKNNITNLTKYNIRRFDIIVGIAYREDHREAQDLIEEVVERHPTVLRVPEPLVLVDELADSSVNLKVRVWFDRTEFIEARSELIAEIKTALDEAGIEIPYPHRMHYASDDLLQALQQPPGDQDV
jgi:small-conductance mechanosensitive channel